MNDTATQILSIAGALFGFVGMLTGIGAVIYARRQALAAEGPQMPDLELSAAGWTDTPNWYHVEITVRNRTPYSWTVSQAVLKRPRNARIVPTRAISSYSSDGDYLQTPLSEVDASKFSNTTNPEIVVAPMGTKGSPLISGDGDTCVVRFFLYLPSSARRFSIRFILASKASMVRERYSAVISDDIPKMSIPSP